MTPQPDLIRIRPARATDVPLIGALIRELADYERLEHACFVDEQRLHAHLFGSSPRAEVLMLECGDPVGFALFFHTFSTFECAPTLYLEDLFVRPAFRRKGIGERALRHLARLAVERGCRRFEWAVLDWNRPAIEFYEKLGAKLLHSWRFCRLDGDALERLARGDASSQNESQPPPG